VTASPRGLQELGSNHRNSSYNNLLCWKHDDNRSLQSCSLNSPSSLSALCGPQTHLNTHSSLELRSPLASWRPFVGCPLVVSTPVHLKVKQQPMMRELKKQGKQSKQVKMEQGMGFCPPHQNFSYARRSRQQHRIGDVTGVGWWFSTACFHAAMLTSHKKDHTTLQGRKLTVCGAYKALRTPHDSQQSHDARSITSHSLQLNCSVSCCEHMLTVTKLLHRGGAPCAEQRHCQCTILNVQPPLHASDNCYTQARL